MKIVEDSPPVLSALDRPNSYIGRSVPRPNLARLTQGRAQFVSDVTLPRMAHVAFVRSPHAHARIEAIETAAAKKAPGVVAVVTGVELAQVITPWVGVLTHLKGIKSAPQHAMAIERARWQGEAVCAVVARTRAEAEDACELVEVVYEELPAVTDAETALDPGTLVIHPELGDNLTFERVHVAGDPDRGFNDADAVVETTFVFGRHTGVCNEPRAIVADWNPGEERLTAYHGTQAPHMMQNLFARHLGHRGAPGARRDQGRGRIVRHQGAHLRRRDGDGGAVEAAQAPDQVRRRPHRELRHRHPCPRPPRQGEDRREERRNHHRLGDRRPHRHRALLGLSAHVRHRGQPDREPHRRALYLPELPRPRPRRIPEQERHVPVSRRRASDRDGGDRGAGRACRRQDRHGPAGDPAPQSHRRRRASFQRPVGDQVRGAVASRIARAPRRDDELRGPARRAEAAARSSASIAASALPASSR